VSYISRNSYLGIGKDIDFVNIPRCIDSNIIEAKIIVRINSATKQTFAILNDGYNNDSFELGRNGRVIFILNYIIFKKMMKICNNQKMFFSFLYNILQIKLTLR
jgi:hypothetical protein